MNQDPPFVPLTVSELTGSTALIDQISTPEEKAELLAYLQEHGRLWDE